MKNKYSNIYIPKVNVNDDNYIIVNLFYEDGDKVKQGDIIATAESSKTSFDIESPCEGFIFYNAHENDLVEVNHLFAVVNQINKKPLSFKEVPITTSTNDAHVEALYSMNQDVRISKAARKLISENQLNLTIFNNKKLISIKDVNKIINKTVDSNHEVNTNNELNTNGLILIGFGGMTKMCIEIIHQTKSHQIAGIIDIYTLPGTNMGTYKVLGKEDILQDLFHQGIRNALITFAGLNNKQKNRNETYQKLKEIGFILPNIIHSKAIIEPSAKLGEGNIILAGSIIGSDTRIGNNCIVNTGAILSHDSILGNNVHLAPGAVLAGRVKVGNDSLIGMGVTVYSDTKIGEGVIIKNGTNVFADIPDFMNAKKNSY